ncbi:hypothetical protein EMIT0P395_70120 [Pseudomonas sp. IT-P395]
MLVHLGYPGYSPGETDADSITITMHL